MMINSKKILLVFLVLCFLKKESMLQQCDLMIAIGGDGTFIHAAHDAARYDKEILGINAGSLGFLAGLEKTELHLLRALTEENYQIDKRMMLCVEHYEGRMLLEKHYCLNDAVFARGTSMRLCDISVHCGSSHVNDYFADGVIFATPTGSTAYSLSAGGPVLEPTIESVILTPICPHSLFSRSLIFRPESVFTLEIPLCDSQSHAHLQDHPHQNRKLYRRAVAQNDRTPALIKEKER